MRVTLIRRAHLLTLAVALMVALVVVSLTIPTKSLAAASKSNLPGNPPEFTLMRGDTVIQRGRLDGVLCWFWWTEYPDSVEERKDLPPPSSKWANKEGYWTGVCGDIAIPVQKEVLYPRDPVLVHAGSTLHIRINHARRPDKVQLLEGLKPSNKAFGWGRPLDYTLRRYRPDDATVAWDVFFRVSQPDRHYYLQIWTEWDRVPGKHKSYGDSGRFFHVKTR